MSKSFLAGAIATPLVFVAINLAAAHLQSDCGISAVIGLWLPSLKSCADDIVRIGFPFRFFEEGGFAFRSIFNLGALLGDVLVALAASVVVGLLARRLAK